MASAVDINDRDKLSSLNIEAYGGSEAAKQFVLQGGTLATNRVGLEEKQAGQILWDLKNQKNKITIISHRHSDTIPAVVTWLQRNWIVYNNLVFLGNTENKLKYVDCLIDDHPRAAEKAIEYPNKTFYLRNQPWNQEDQGDNIIRLDSLEDFYGRTTQ